MRRILCVLQAEELREHHLREGFEASSADRIFESTTLAAAAGKQQQQEQPQQPQGAP